MNKRNRPYYGIDAPNVLRNLAAAGLLCAVLAALVQPLRWMYSPALSLLLSAAVWVYGSLVGKLRLREKMMDALRLSVTERVLDVGCGSGLLMVGAAKRLSAGTAVGVDIWRSQDLSNSGKETALRNAAREGVADRVSVEEGDVRNLPFADATFDAAVSLNVLHNISERKGREQALIEVVRVLKPGGRLLICDFRNTAEYTGFLKASGVDDARRQFIGWVGFFPMYAAVGTKNG